MAHLSIHASDGLLHATDISYGRVTHPAEVLHAGDEITVGAEVRSLERAGVARHGRSPGEGVLERFPVNTAWWGAW